MIHTLALILAAVGDASATARTATLTCGAAEFALTSSTVADPTGPLAPVAQTLIRRSGATHRRVPLERGGSAVVGGQRVRDRYVASWACIAGRWPARYVVIGYACTADPGNPGDCGGDKEWFRLLDTRGRFVDTAVPHDGVARDRLYARLGIADTMAAGVTMTPVVK